jgi:hypothetical protein
MLGQPACGTPVDRIRVSGEELQPGLESERVVGHANRRLPGLGRRASFVLSHAGTGTQGLGIPQDVPRDVLRSELVNNFRQQFRSKLRL